MPVTRIGGRSLAIATTSPEGGEIMRYFKVSAFAVAVLLTGFSGFAARATMMSADPMVGGAAMYPTRNIVQNAVHSKDHTILVTAVKAAGLVDTLEGPGPFTVFAPTNAAFAKLPPGTVDNLLKPENKSTLVSVLTYHVVPGRYSARRLEEMVKMGGGRAELKTVEGATLTVKDDDGKLEIIDAKGDKAWVTISNVNQSNGVIHVINRVLLPG
jgi:uncharacterized surface protein with fasciclin (FAS1) repeats